MSDTTHTEDTNLFVAARDCILAHSADDKARLSKRTAKRWRTGRLDQTPPADAPEALTPGFPPEMELVHPFSVKKRRMSTPAGKRAFVHAIAHIEFNAINLAWDCVYRFRDMPKTFYDDWVRVADEETKHFGLLCNRLDDLETRYGEFPSHNGLWEMAEKTQHDFTERMALVPRFLEARGLDVTPGMIARLEKLGDAETAAILRVILKDEIGHVAVGTRWFRWSCEREGVDPAARFAEILREKLRGRVKPPINETARREAGFDETELNTILEMTKTEPTGGKHSAK